MLSRIITLLSLVLMPQAFTCDMEGKTGFFPENNLYIGVNDKSGNQMTKEEFDNIIDRVEAVYAPIVKDLGGKLEIARNWDDGTVNAYAKRIGDTYHVAMFGGLARHSLITKDGFSLVLCHELGHHLGGAPKIGGFFNKWASNEGQSDYFATMKCFKRVYGLDDNETIVMNSEVEAVVKEKCQENFKSNQEYATCVRAAIGGLSLANVLNSLGSSTSEVKFSTPDKNVVKKTDDAHPKAQCRLDTYFQGALCTKDIFEALSDRNPITGTCTEKEKYKTGTRPLCWYSLREEKLVGEEE